MLTLLKNLYDYKYTINSRSIWAVPFDCPIFFFFLTMTENLLFNNTADILCAILSSVIGL